VLTRCWTKYAPLLFQQAGLSSNEATFLASGASAIIIFCVTIPATIFADRWGRRISTILGGVGMAATMFLIGGLYAGGAVHPSSGAGRWVVIVSIYVYVVIFCISWAVGIRVYAAEIQPQRTRARATSTAHGVNWLSNFTVALITPTLLAKTTFGAYFLFGSCMFLTAVVCWLFMPETRGKSLDEIDEAYHRSHVRGLKELVPGRALRQRFMRRVTMVEEA
jgi:MFS family permease